MLIYILCFSIVILFTYLLEKNRKEKNVKIFEYIYITIIVVVITLFAGFRDETVGTDVHVYAEPVLNAVNNYGFEFAYNTANVEFLFVVLAQIASWIDGDLNTFLIIIQFIMTIFVMVAILNEKVKKKSIILYILTYLTMFYGIGFNLMRQSIAMTIILYSFKFVKEEKLIKYCIFILLASLFHSTAIFMIILYPLWKLLNNKDSVIIKTFVLIGIVGVIAFIPKILTLLIEINLLPLKFERYVEDINNSTINIQFLLTGVKLIFLAICFIICKYSKDRKVDSFCFFLLLMDIILFQLGALAPFIERISYYFGIVGYMEIIPKSISVVKQDKFNIGAMYMGVSCLLLIYFYISFVYLKISSIIPYTSQILHIR